MIEFADEICAMQAGGKAVDECRARQLAGWRRGGPEDGRARDSAMSA